MLVSFFNATKSKRLSKEKHLINIDIVNISNTLL